MSEHGVAVPERLLLKLRSLGPSAVFVYLFLLRHFKRHDRWHVFSYRGLQQAWAPGGPSINTIHKALGALMDEELVFTRSNTERDPESGQIFKISELKLASVYLVVNADTRAEKDVSPGSKVAVLNGDTPSKSGGGSCFSPIGIELDSKTAPIKIVREIFAVWNEHGPVKHSKLTDKMARSIRSALKRLGDYDDPVLELKQAIILYGEIVGSSDYWWQHEWTLNEFCLPRKQKEDPITMFLADTDPKKRNKTRKHKPGQAARTFEKQRTTGYEDL